ncbi:hypothetical protein [uncultured Rubinisphaera sp.]|uniref:hypothetical protein n=1 Tax=uncultured Rubinisphaera sp. TaxID=1678686 RepID=UPI0030D8CB7B
MNYDLDDLGKEDGLTQIQCAGMARELVLSYRVIAAGNRPRDHAQRDLLIGGWQKDPRCRGFRILIKNKDPRFYKNTLSLAKNNQETCARARAFQYMHAAALYRFQKCLEGNQRVSGILRSMLNCPPTLIYFDAKDLKRNGFRTCNRIRLCPYCLSRKVLSLYDRMCEDFKVGTNKCLALLAVTAQLDTSELTTSSSEGIDYQFKAIAKDVRNQLVNLAKKHLGFTGGLTVADAGPILFTNDNWSDGELIVDHYDGLELHTAVLGEIPFGKMSELEEKHSVDELKFSPIEFGNIECQPILTIRLCKERDALRSLLFGQAPSKHRGKNVIDGAFRFPPWYLATPSQWTQHHLATKSLKLYQFWGDWEKLYNECPTSKSKPKGFVNASVRRGRYKSQLNLITANNRRQYEKEQNLEILITRIRPIWVKLCNSLKRRPGWLLLLRKANEEGVDLSERQSRGIIKRLNNE